MEAYVFKERFQVSVTVTVAVTVAVDRGLWPLTVTVAVGRDRDRWPCTHGNSLSGSGFFVFVAGREMGFVTGTIPQPNPTPKGPGWIFVTTTNKGYGWLPLGAVGPADTLRGLIRAGPRQRG